MYAFLHTNGKGSRNKDEITSSAHLSIFFFQFMQSSCSWDFLSLKWVSLISYSKDHL